MLNFIIIKHKFYRISNFQFPYRWQWDICIYLKWQYTIESFCFLWFTAGFVHHGGLEKLLKCTNNVWAWKYCIPGVQTAQKDQTNWGKNKNSPHGCVDFCLGHWQVLFPFPFLIEHHDEFCITVGSSRWGPNITSVWLNQWLLSGTIKTRMKCRAVTDILTFFTPLLEDGLRIPDHSLWHNVKCTAPVFVLKVELLVFGYQVIFCTVSPTTGSRTYPSQIPSIQIASTPRENL